MIWVIIYLLGVIVAGILEYHEARKCCKTRKDSLKFMGCYIFSWFTVLTYIIGCLHQKIYTYKK